MMVKKVISFSRIDFHFSCFFSKAMSRLLYLLICMDPNIPIPKHYFITILIGSVDVL